MSLTPVTAVFLLIAIGLGWWAKDAATQADFIIRFLVLMVVFGAFGLYSLTKLGPSFPNMMVDRIRRSLCFLPKRSEKDSDL